MTTKEKTIEELGVGDGVTLCMYSDRMAMTIVEKSDRKLVAQRDNAELDPAYKPEFVAGGFAGHCVNQHEQKWICTPNPDAYRETFTLRKNGKWIRKGESLKASYLVAGRQPFHDYNF